MNEVAMLKDPGAYVSNPRINDLIPILTREKSRTVRYSVEMKAST